MAKPAFDPSQPFEPAPGTEKPVFDPSQPFEPAGPSGLASAGRGALQGATLGFGDEGAGALTGLMQAVVNVLPKALQDRLDLVPASSVDAYRYSRDSERAANKGAKEAHPWLYGGGEVAGGLATVPFQGPAKGLKALTLAGAKLGAAGGLGSSNADLTQGEFGQAAMDTGIGAGLGAGAGALAAGISAGAGALPGALQRFGGRRAVKAVGALKSDLSGMSPDQIDRLGKFLLDNKLVRAGETVEGALGRINAAREAQGQQIGDLLDVVDSLGGGRAFSASKVASRVRNGLLKDVRANPALQTVAEGPIETLLGNIEGGANSAGQRMMSFPQANEFESTLSKGLYNKLDPAPKIETLQKLRDVVNDEINQQVKAISPGVAEHLAVADRNYGPLAQASNIGNRAIQRAVGNNYFGLASKTAGGMTLLHALSRGSPTEAALAAGGMLAGHALEGRMASTAAVASNALGKALGATPEAVASTARAAPLAAERSILADWLAGHVPTGSPALADDESARRSKAMAAALRGSP